MAGPYLTNPLEQINQAWQQGRNMAFQDAAGNALTSTGPEQQAALTQATQLNPTGSLDLQQKNQQVTGQRLVSMARFLVNAPPEQRDAAYQAMKPALGQLGIDPSTLPANYDDTVEKTAQSLVQAYTPYNAIPAAVRTDQYFTQNLDPTDLAHHLRIKAGLDARATADNWQTKEVPDVNGNIHTLVHNARTNQWEVPDFSSIQNGNPDYSAAPSRAPTPAGAGWNTTVAKPDAAQIANSVLDRGGTMDEAGAEVQRQVGPNQVTAIHINPATGRFENLPTPAGATPTRLDAAGNEVTAPAAVPTATAAGPGALPAISPLGVKLAKPDPNEIDKRVKEIAALDEQGVHLTPEQRNEYMLTGKAPDASKPTELTPDQERIANAIAGYQFGTPARFFSDPKNQGVIARALALNPTLNQAQYDQNKKLLTDLASNVPTSAGGGIVAANTAMKHIEALSELSDKLPDHMPVINALQAKIAAAAGHSDLANNLSSWETEVGLAAAEIQKMIKSGVATEGETSKMMQDLSSAKDLGQRRAALASLAEFMNDKVQAQENRRDQVLGDLSPRTSFLNAKSQDIFRDVMSKGQKTVPDLLPPSTSLGMAVRPMAGAAVGSRAAAAPNIPQAAIDHLRQNPALRDAFDQKYGTGSAASVLGGP